MDAADLADVLRRHATRHGVPGAAAGILGGGEAVTAHHGVADLATGEPVTPSTRFSIGSLTKSLVATVIAGLADEGQLSLDDPAAAHVPELRGCAWAERATVRDLLANRSGIPLREALEFGFASRADADDGALARLVADVAACAPTSPVWSYSNAGWCVLGRVVETATGVPFEDAMQQRAAAAGLTETTFAPGAARAYGPAGASAAATAADVLRFAARHLTEASLATLREVHADVAIHGWLDAWCLGLARFDWDGTSAFGWDGVLDDARAVVRIVPARRAAFVVLANGRAGRALARSLIAEVAEALHGIRVPPLRLDVATGAAGDLERFAGTYAWPDRRVDVGVSGHGLVLVAGGEETEALPLDDRAFLVDAADPDTPAVTFGAFDAAGRPGVLYEMLWGLPRIGA